MDEVQGSVAHVDLVMRVFLPCLLATGIVFWAPSVRNIVKAYLTPRQVIFLGAVFPALIVTSLLHVQPLPESTSLWYKGGVAAVMFTLTVWVVYGVFRTAVLEDADRWKE